MEGKVSVVIPIYNVEKYFRKCLDSVVNQTYRNLEIILVDDGSPDSCGNICDEYAQRDTRVVVIHKTNEGLSAARNDGIKRATGEWIAFIDSDDWCELDYFERMLETADSNEADLIFAGGYYMDYLEKEKVIHTFSEDFVTKDRRGIEALAVRALLSGNRESNVAFGYPWDKLYRASFIVENQLLFDTSQRMWEDCWFNFRFLLKSQLVVGGGTIGYHYRQTISSITRGYDPRRVNTIYNVCTIMNDYANRNELTGGALQVIKEVPISAISVCLNSYFSPKNNASYKEVAKAVKDMKRLSLFHDAIWRKGSCFLSDRQRVLKMALRLPWIWPVKVLYLLKEFSKEAIKFS